MQLQGRCDENLVRANPFGGTQFFLQARPLQREKFDHAPDHRATDRRNGNKCRSYVDVFHGDVPAMTLENSEPVSTQ